MGRYSRKELAQLVHQLNLSPQRLRDTQIRGAEKLAGLIEPDKTYPYDFVCFQITDYRKANGTTQSSLLGSDLLADLSTLVDDLSRKSPTLAEDCAEKLKTTEELAQRLEVSTKTIARWRSRGLIGRRYQFSDGRVTLAFAESMVQRFVGSNAELVRRAAAFKQLTDDERKGIVATARELLAARRMKLHEIAQEISARTGRAVETIRYTLRRYDRENPTEAVFANDGVPQVCPEHRRIFDAYLAGDTVRDIAAALRKRQKDIRAIIHEMRCRRILDAPLSYIYSPEFDDPSAGREILESDPCETIKMNRRRCGDSRTAQPYLQDLSTLPVLTAETERDLFRQYNFLKFNAAQLREDLDPMEAPLQRIERIEELMQRALKVQAMLIQCNLRLVVSIAKRHVGNAPDLFETSSDGNIALMRAVEKFDYTRGNKFSTYASWAIMRNYARTIPEHRYRNRRYQTGTDELLESAPDARPADETKWERKGLRDRIGEALTSLDQREREIVQSHFGLARSGQTQTLEQIGKRLGVTKERIRQIERRALIKLRGVLPESCLDLVSD